MKKDIIILLVILIALVVVLLRNSQNADLSGKTVRTQQKDVLKEYNEITVLKALGVKDINKILQTRENNKNKVPEYMLNAVRQQLNKNQINIETTNV